MSTLSKTSIDPKSLKFKEARDQENQTHFSLKFLAASTLPTLLRRQSNQLLMSGGLAPIPVPSANEPIDHNDQDHNSINGRNVIHIARMNRLYWWERVHNQSKSRPCEKDDV